MKRVLFVPQKIWAALLWLLPTFHFSCSNEPTRETAKEKYTVIKPLLSDTTYIQEYVANIQAIQNVEIRARARGFIEKILVDEGKAVKKGQLLFTLNSNEYQQEKAKAKANLASVRAAFRQVEVELKNTKILSEKNIVSLSELEVMQTKKEAIEAQIQEAEANIALAEIHLKFTEIRAPFNGIINRIPNKVGALVEEGGLLTTISNNDEIFAYFNVSETDYLNYLTQNNRNKKVNLKLANGDVFPQEGVIETIDGEIDQRTGSLSFRAKFPNPDRILKHGSSGKVLVRNLFTNAMMIPQQSTFEVQENLYVFVLDKKNRVKQRQIQIEMRLANMYVVKEGLSISDKVLFDGVQVVKDGDKIVPDFKNYSQLNK